MAVMQLEINNPDDNIWIKIYNNTIAPLWLGIKQWFGVVAITIGILYANTLFNMQHDIFPLSISISIASGVAWTYISGLAYVAATEKVAWSTHAMIFTGALTDCLFGLLYVLGRYKVIPETPDSYVATGLALAHVIPLIILVIIFTYCKKLYLAEQAATKHANDKRIERYKEAKLNVEIAKEEIELEKARLRLDLARNKYVNDKEQKTCDFCQNALSQAQYGAMKRYGYCSKCKPK
jgi:ABC-type multidrug transport system fused ATPase/permease subunit